MLTQEFSPNALLVKAGMQPGKVCDMTYLINMSRGNKMIIQKILTVFFKETSKELTGLSKAIEDGNYPGISNISHKLKSAFSILGIITLEPVFKEMEYLSSNSFPPGKIEQLNQRVNIAFNQARVEMAGNL